MGDKRKESCLQDVMETRVRQKGPMERLADVNVELRDKVFAMRRKCAGIEVTRLHSLLGALAHLNGTGELP